MTQNLICLKVINQYINSVINTVIQKCFLQPVHCYYYILLLISCIVITNSKFVFRTRQNNFSYSIFLINVRITQLFTYTNCLINIFSNAWQNLVEKHSIISIFEDQIDREIFFKLLRQLALTWNYTLISNNFSKIVQNYTQCNVMEKIK